jgi:hypothetical protein
MRNAPTNPSMAESAWTTATLPDGGPPVRNVMNDWKLNRRYAQSRDYAGPVPSVRA